MASEREGDGPTARGEGSMCMHTHIPKDRLERPVGEGGDQERRRGERRKTSRRAEAEYLRSRAEDSVFKFSSEREKTRRAFPAVFV